MVGHRCIVCGNTSHLNPDCLFHRFPSNLSTRLRWLQVLGIIRAIFIKICMSARSIFPLEIFLKDHKVIWVKDLLPRLKKLPRAMRAKCRDLVKDISVAIPTGSGTIPTGSGTMPTAAGSVNSTDTDRPVDGSEVQLLATFVGAQIMEFTNCQQMSVTIHQKPIQFLSSLLMCHHY